jgi:hypothetical protein
MQGKGSVLARWKPPYERRGKNEKWPKFIAAEKKGIPFLYLADPPAGCPDGLQPGQHIETGE